MRKDNAPICGEDVLRILFRDHELTNTARAMFRFLLIERDRIDVDLIPCRDKQIAEAIGCSDRQVRRGKDELAKKGFIRPIKRKFDPVTGKCKPTRYNIQPGKRLIEMSYGCPMDTSYGKDRANTESPTDHRTPDPSDILSGELLHNSKESEDAAPAVSGGSAPPPDDESVTWEEYTGIDPEGAQRISEFTGSIQRRGRASLC